MFLVENNEIYCRQKLLSDDGKQYRIRPIGVLQRKRHLDIFPVNEEYPSYSCNLLRFPRKPTATSCLKNMLAKMGKSFSRTQQKPCLPLCKMSFSSHLATRIILRF